jgi:iron complex transport system ATP-binding protein
LHEPGDQGLSPALRFSNVSLRLEPEPAPILDGIDWEVGPGERWAVLGPNGSGKTSLLRLAAGWLHPSSGSVDVLGHRLGRTDVRELRTRIGYASAALEALLSPDVTASDIVLSGIHAALEPWWHTYSGQERARARELLEQMGCGHLANRPFSTLSDGERKRVQLARTLVTDPYLLLLDEPAAALDLGGREALVDRLGRLAADPAAPPTVLVTHHVEEIPRGFTHALLLRAGRVSAAGPLSDALTCGTLSEAFGMAVSLEQRDGRWVAFGG